MPEDYAIIREIYEGEGAPEDFENELDRALEEGVSIIIIEPTKLGDETGRWITVGNCLHKTAVLSGAGSLLCGGLSTKWPIADIGTYSLGFISFMCAGLYMVSWQYDACCKYQVEHDVKKLQRIPLNDLTSPSPVVLVRKDDTVRKVLHTTLATMATGLCIWKLYDWYNIHALMYNGLLKNLNGK